MVSYIKNNQDELSSPDCLTPSPTSFHTRNSRDMNFNLSSTAIWNGKRKTERNKDGRKWSCMICKKDHRLATCTKYMGMSTHKRLEIIRQLRYCVNCLAISHSIKTCRSPATCSVCHKRHHSTLHHTTPSPIASVAPAAGSLNVDHKLNDEEKVPSQAGGKTSPSVIPKHVVIPTVRMALIYNGIRRIVRALINPSQPFTTISEIIAKQCKLQTKMVDNKSMCCVQLGNIQDLNWMEELQAMITNVLPLRPYPQDLKIATPFDTLLLADPDFYISDEVHIVLAADIYPKIISDGLLTHETGEIVAQKTIFGWTLTGSVSG